MYSHDELMYNLIPKLVYNCTYLKLHSSIFKIIAKRKQDLNDSFMTVKTV